MPRSKEAISVLKGFLRGELKGPADSGDVIFAKGIKAALEWLTQEDRPCPYAELADDLGDDGGWITAEAPAQSITSKIELSLPPIENIVNRPLWTPDQPMPTDLEQPSMAAPGSFEAMAKAKPWLNQIAADLAGIQDGTPLSDRNAVVVGAGLGDAPLLRGGYDG